MRSGWRELWLFSLGKSDTGGSSWQLTPNCRFKAGLQTAIINLKLSDFYLGTRTVFFSRRKKEFSEKSANGILAVFFSLSSDDVQSRNSV